MRDTLAGDRPKVLLILIVLLCAFVTYHSFNDYLTTRDVARTRDVVHDICLAQNRENAAIRVVLEDGIRSARRGELAFPQFKAQFEDQILQSERYLSRLFRIEHC